jgi:RNA polymerase sigma-70 factor, ECF subfamily
MNVTRRYAANLEEARSLVNEGMLKVFQQLHTYNPDFSFGGWVRRIMVNTAIDHFRKVKAYEQRFQDIDRQDDFSDKDQATVIDGMSAEELLVLVQQLPPAYRVVFSLYAVEEYTHKEIAEELGISEGTSKSNYAKARAKLQQALAGSTITNQNYHGQRK